MAWPSSAGLSKSNFDEATDSPASARSELEALYDHVLLISNEVTDSATVWHSGNDGATSGLDADLLDGQEGSFYQNAGNLNAGTIPLAQIPATLTGKNADQLDGQEGSYYTNSANHTGTTTVDVNTDSLTVNGSAITNIDHITKMYAGRVDSGGTTGNLPSGWTVSKASSTYTITHSLNTTDVTFVGTCEGSTRKVTINSRALSTIQVTTTDSSNNVAADAAFDFILIVN
jgi:hypothetical protein